jgi:hypothetical protein
VPVLYKCILCGKEFYAWPCAPKYGQAKYCSIKCRGLAMRSREIRKCALPSCQREFEVWPHSTKKFCRPRCAYDSFKKNKKQPELVGVR